MSEIVKRRKDGNIRLILTNDQADVIYALVGAMSCSACTDPLYGKLRSFFGKRPMDMIAYVPIDGEYQPRDVSRLEVKE